MGKKISKNLFNNDDIELDNNHYNKDLIDEEEKDKEDEEEEKDKYIQKDKIFGNKYNTGDLEFQYYSEMKIKDDFNFMDPKFTDYSYSHYTTTELQLELYELFEKSSFFETYRKIKRVPKKEVMNIYYYFADDVKKSNTYTNVEMFIEICNFMNLNFKDTFNNLLPYDKQLIVKELDMTYDIFKKNNIKKLF